MENIKFHARIAWRGFCRTAYGAGIAVLFAISIYKFINVAGESGWAAVCDFIAAIANMAIGLANMYFIGSCKKKSSSWGKGSGR